MNSGASSLKVGKRFVAAEDASELVIAGFAELVSRMCPFDRWCAFTQAVGYGTTVGRRQWSAGETRRLQEILGPYAAEFPEPAQLLRRSLSAYVEEMALHSRLAQRSSWRPRLEIEGAGQLEDAIARGGVVLWILPQRFATLLTRLAAYDAGWPLCHLSHWAHGPSTTAFGQAFLTKRQRRIEDRLSDRVTIGPEGAVAALRELSRRLHGGSLVSFRGIATGSQPKRYPWLGGYLDLALGAPAMAIRHEAPLFLVSVGRIPGGFRIAFSPLRDAAELGAEECGARFSEAYERVVRAEPDLWPVTYSQIGTEP